MAIAGTQLRSQTRAQPGGLRRKGVSRIRQGTHLQRIVGPQQEKGRGSCPPRPFALNLWPLSALASRDRNLTHAVLEHAKDDGRQESKGYDGSKHVETSLQFHLPLLAGSKAGWLRKLSRAKPESMYRAAI
jgi:hypothetical protein